MKKIPLICVIVSALFTSACARQESPKTEQAPLVVDMHNARNALDYEGTYRPQAMLGANALQEVQIRDKNRYVYTTGAGARVSGTFRWDNSGNQIILEHAAETPLVFFVGENHLKLISKGSQEGLVFQKD